MIVGRAVTTINVATTVPAIIARTKVSLEAVPTTLVGTTATTIIVGTAVQTMVAGAKITLMVVPTTFVGPVVPTNVVGTTIHINSLKIGQFDFEVFLGGNEPKILYGVI